MKRDLQNNLKVERGLAPQTVTGTDATVNGESIDLGPNDPAIGIMVDLDMGVSGDVLAPALRADFRLQESDDNSNWTDVADADVYDAVAVSGKTGVIASIDDPAEDDAVYKSGYRGVKRYIRPVIDLVGAHASGFPCAIRVTTKRDKMPQA